MKPGAASSNPSAWPWPESLDARIAAQAYHELLMENERVRVLDVRIPPGHLVPVHTHRWPSVIYTLSFGHFVRRDADGKVLLDTRTVESSAAPPGVVWSGPMPPHSVENVGESDVRALVVELKD